MADPQYIYIAAAPAVVAPASYSYSGYTQPAEASYVQPGYNPAPVTAYTYDQGQFASAVVSHSSYGQPEYSQSSYTSPGQSSYSQPAAAAYGASVTTYVSATPYNVVSSAYVAPAEQTPTYGQPSYAQPVVGYSAAVAQPSSAYGQPPAQQTVVYGQLPSQQPVAIGQPNVQQPAAYIQPNQQTPLYGQPPAQQQPSAYGPPAAAAVQQAFAYATGQAPGTPQPSSYGQPVVQAAPLGAPPAAQLPPGYVPTVATQQLPSYGQPAAQQPPPYGQPSASQPPVYGQPPAQSTSFNQNPGYIPPSPVPLAQPPVFLGAAGGGPPGASPLPAIQPLPAPGSIGHLSGGPGLFGRGRGGIGGLGGGGPSRGFGGERGGGGGDRIHNSNVMPVGEIEVQQFPDTIFVQGLSEDVSEETLAQHFGAIGKLKTDTKTGKPRVWLVRDKVTGRPRGEATIGYEDVSTVATAIDLFNNKDFQGRKIRVQVASRKIPAGAPPHAPSIGSDRGGMSGRGRSSGSGGSGGGGQPDWICRNMDCGNQNFGWRQECNRCKAPRDGPQNSENGPDDGPLQVIRGGFRGGLGPRGGRGGNRGGLVLAEGDHGGLGRGVFRGGVMMNAIGPFRGRGGPIRGRDRMDRRGRPY